MGWRELTIHDVPRGLADTVAAALFTAGAAGTEETHAPGQAPPPRQPWDTGAPPPAPKTVWIKGWFEDPDTHAVAATLAAVLPSPTVAWTDVPDTDWEQAAEQAFPPVVVSPDLTVAAPWDAPPGALLIEPGAGFGTGHHASTRQALALLEEALHDASPGSLLDVGCGSGVLALVAARAGWTAWGIDVDADAVANARHNAALNELTARFDTTPLDRVDQVPDVVVANLYGELLVALAAQLRRLGRHRLIVAGVLDDREAAVVAALAPLTVVQRRQEDRWVALVFTGEG